jgi:hypothetical protein
MFLTKLKRSRINSIQDIDKLVKYLDNKIIMFKPFMPIPNHVINLEQARLFRIHDVLIGKFAKLYIGTKELRGIHDKFFNALNIKVPRIRFAQLPTFLSTRFCQGITYFKNNAGIDAIPFYHRNNSCGSRLNRNNMNDKFFVKNCYIERMIYDQIYNYVFHEQDLGHVHELKLVERKYQEFYKNERLIITVSFSQDQLYPNQLIIMTLNDDGIKNEIYTKAFSSNLVYCTKYSGAQKYEKTQTFSQETPWILTSA